MPLRDRFREASDSGVLILDAAMGTRLMAEGLSIVGDDPSLWNLTHPEAVIAIHRRDRSAGADVLTTNTFGANRFWLARYHRADQVGLINRRAVSLARSAAGPRGFVLGDMGPSCAQQPGAAVEQAEILVDAGVDALLLETFRLDQAVPSLREVAGSARVPLLVSLFDWPEAIGDATRRLVDAGADLLGMNCQPGMAGAIAFAERVRAVTDTPLFVRPSAADPGDPARDAESFAAAVPRLSALGVRLIGGCCGTTEVHVAALRSACYAGDSEG